MGLLLALATAGCGPAQWLGVGVDDLGTVSVHWACADREVQRIRVTVAGSEDPLWEVVSDGGATELTAFPVGAVPDGFTQVQALDAPLEATTRLRATLETADDQQYVNFTIADLEPGIVIAAGHEVPVGEFDVFAQERCGEQS